MRKWVSAFFLIVATMGAAVAQDMSSFQASAERMAAALKSLDVDAITQMYAEDARILPPGKDIIQGREAIKAFWIEDLKTTAEITVTQVDAKPLGDSNVLEIGRFSGKTAGDNPEEFAGKFITIWHKVGDDWKATDDIWNLNK